MDLDPAQCYRAIQARDARYDGVFFTCVRTTGIYCRPICPARPPKFENCRFVATASAAQEAGFRPCLRCRPESSPDFGAWRGASATVSRALTLIEEGALDDGDVGALAERLGVGERHLRRLFSRHLGAAPVTVAQTRRVLLAKQLIHETDLPMIEVALASGFNSLRRFNETFQQLYRRPPGELRRRASGKAPASGLTLLLPYRPPYDWDSMIRFLAARALPGLETVAEKRYARVVEIGGAVGSIEIADAPEKSALRAIVRFPRLEHLAAIVARVRRLFDLGADPVAIGAALSRDPTLAPLLAARPGLRVPGAWDGFEIATRAILGQQITVKAATRLGAKLVAALGDPIGEQAGLDARLSTAEAARRREDRRARHAARPRRGDRRDRCRGRRRSSPFRAPPRSRRGHNAAAPAARRRRMDRAIHCDARFTRKRRLPCRRRRLAESARDRPAKAARSRIAGSRRSLAALARLRRAASLDGAGDRERSRGE
jgi:AraC family transcriptional regulator of adaptative response / DNA-3-methyladenine glycosylase II